MNPEFRFVRMGELAPADVSPGEVWVDVGGRLAARVLDHHDTAVGLRSVAEMIVGSAESIATEMQGAANITFVTHEDPDLDAIGSIWLLTRIARDGPDFASRDVVRQLVETISDNDQGICIGDPESYWPTVFRIRLASECSERGSTSLDRLTRGMALVDESFRILKAGARLADAAEGLKDISTRRHLNRARLDYEQDCLRATPFQLSLPLTLRDVEHPVSETAPTALVDALFLPNPRCTLFKEMARADRERSPMGHGFQALVVARPLSGIPRNAILASRSPVRYRISVDPLAGVNLRGLGAALESAEKARDREDRGLRVPERRSLADGEGRFGLGVPSPWYDGRGHEYTIIDSPSFYYGGQAYCGSALRAHEVLDIVWKHGAPANFVTAERPAITFVMPATCLDRHYTDRFCTAVSFPDALHRALIPSVQQLLKLDDGSQALRGWEAARGEPLDHLIPLELEPLVHCDPPQLWEFEGGFVWSVSYRLLSDCSLQEFARTLASLRAHLEGSLSSSGFQERERLSCPNPADLFHIASTTVSLGDLLFDPNHPFALGTVYQLAQGVSPTFGELPAKIELSHMSVVSSHDAFFHSSFGSKGVACISVGWEVSGDSGAFYSGDSAKVLAACVMAQKHSLDELLAHFTEHKYGGFLQGLRRTVEDRTRLLELEQSILFERITEHTYGQALFNALRGVLQIESTLDVARSQIESLVQRVKEHREQFLGRMAFWITLILGPITVVGALFSGRQLDPFYKDLNDPVLDLVEVGLVRVGLGVPIWIRDNYLGWFSLACHLLIAMVSVLIVWGAVKAANRNLKLRREPSKRLASQITDFLHLPRRKL